jgi:hypothetical protein
MNVSDKRRKWLKAWAKRNQAGRRDRLAEGAAPRWRAGLLLGSLQACAMRAGWDYDRRQRFYAMAERIPAVVLHGRTDPAALAEVDKWR